MISHGIKSSGIDPLVQQRTGLVNKQLTQKIMQLLGLGAGVGLAARGAQGVYNLGRRAMTSPNAMRPTTITVPSYEEEKVAFIDGSNATDWTGHPLAIPLSVGAAGGGALGGWKLMDYVLDRRRKAQMKNELESTKKQYERALLSQYDKHASELGRDLDHLFSLMQEKQASGWDLAGQAAGTALLGAGGIALLSGMVTHNIAGKRRRQSLLQKAMRKRRREQAMAQPTQIFAMPQPMSPTTSMNSAPTEEDLNGQPLDKVAEEAPGAGYYAAYRAKADAIRAQREQEQAALGQTRQDRAMSAAKSREGSGGPLVQGNALIGRNSQQGQQLLQQRSQQQQQVQQDQSYRGLMDQATQFIQQRDQFRAAGDTAGEQQLYASPEYKTWSQAYQQHPQAVAARQQAARPQPAAQSAFRPRQPAAPAAPAAKPAPAAAQRPAMPAPKPSGPSLSGPAKPASGGGKPASPVPGAS